MPTFTEMWQATPITLTGGEFGGLLENTFTSIPQSANYSNLYRQFRILKNTWYIIPRSNSADFTNALYNVSPAVAVPAVLQGRFVYSVNNTAGATDPSSEVEVLTDNGARVKVSTRVIKISHRPVPRLNTTTSVVAQQFIGRKATWLNTDSNEQTGSGTGVVHTGVSIYVTVPTAQPSLIYYDVYCKTTFQLRDPC
jgi:hypothetical protein